MAYRSPEEALRLRAIEIEADLVQLDGRLTAARADLEDVQRDVAVARGRLAEAGPLAGPRGALRDRVAVAGVALALVGAAVAPLHLFLWGDYVARDATVIPAILLLAVPGLLAALVTWPYRAVAATYRWIAVAGTCLAIAPFANVVVHLAGGWWSW